MHIQYGLTLLIGREPGEYGRKKSLFQKGNSVGANAIATSDDGILINTYFKEYENNLMIQIAYKDESGNLSYHDCEIFNIPLQKWVTCNYFT